MSAVSSAANSPLEVTMLVVGEDIIKQNLLKEANRTHIKNSSYYLTIGSIIPVGEGASKLDFKNPPEMLVIKPRQVAWVVSKEVFNITSNSITALVTLRSTFTKQGLLALDVGMVDAGFEGPIGSIVINFSKNDVPLRTGDEFFRVAFIQHPEVAAEFRAPRLKFTAVDYMKQQHSSIVTGFPETFLNTDALSQELGTTITENVKTALLDQVLLHIVKEHWKKLAGAVVLLAGLVILVVYLLLAKYGPNLTDADVQKMIKTAIENRLLGQPPPQK
jgi:deoxycytidine triphosphate deaminase